MRGDIRSTAYSSALVAVGVAAAVTTHWVEAGILFGGVALQRAVRRRASVTERRARATSPARRRRIGPAPFSPTSPG